MEQTAIKAHTRDTIKIFWQHSKKYGLLLFIVIATLSAGSIADIYKPILYKKFFDLLGSGHATVQALLAVVISVLLLNVYNWVFWRASTYATTYFDARVIKGLYTTCFNALHEHSYRFFSDNFGGTLVRRVNKYSRAYEQITDQIFWSIYPSCIRMIAIIILLYFRFPLIAGIILAWSCAYVVFNYAYANYRMKWDLARSEMDSKVTGFLADTITNSINLKIFTNQELEQKSFHGLSKKLYDIYIKSWNMANLSEAIQSAFMLLLEFGVMYTALRFWQMGQLSIGDFALLQAYLLQIFDRLWDVGRNIRRIYEGFSDANEMTDILLTPIEVKDIPNAGTLSVTNGEIAFKHVGFRYNNHRSVFADFNLTIKPGERVALVGPSGGGKTTITKLLLRFFDIQEGSICVDGQDISRVSQNSLRQNIALVPQEPILFHRPLMENIRYARPDASDGEVLEAAKLAHCHEFISQLPEGYGTHVGERGIKLSGGERQRVAIARAILKNAPILVLDEATSSLDSESEHLIQDALKNLMRGKTTIVIAHRLSTIMQMDRILVLEEGRITEEGKHEELLKAQQGTYQKLWHIQAGGFT